MSHRSRIALALAAPVLALTVLVGCSGRGGEEDEPDESGRPRPRSGGAAAKLTPVQAKTTATLKGRVRLKPGKDPDYEALTRELRSAMEKKDPSVCLSGSPEEIAQSRWVVDKESRGVKNVFVWLKPEDDKKEYFDVKKLVDQKKFPPSVTIDQPHCAFMPHAVVLFQRYINPENPVGNFRLKGPLETGQKFIVKNSAPIGHNTSWSGDAASGGNVLLSANNVKPLTIDDIRPSYTSGVEVKCSIHPWMKAYVWSFPHPFAAVTNEKGEYTIENAPAGVKIRIVAWHEGADFINGGAAGEEITLKEGEHSRDFEFTAK
jgi:hypothetical protein